MISVAAVIVSRPGRIKTRAAHFWNFLCGLLPTGNLAFRLQYLFAIINKISLLVSSSMG